MTVPEGDHDHARPPSGAHQHHETEHATDPQSGILRAAVFGASDGLVSNLALVVGVAGGSGDPQFVLLAGTAGLLAGAFSMAAGEYISMQTQREMLERELAIEQEHLEQFPEEEQAHLGELLEESGLNRDDATRIAAQVHREGGPALHFHAQLELGIDPNSLGAPGGAAASSFASFAIGAAVPLLPWALTDNALPATLVVSGLVLLGVGAVATYFTHRSATFGAIRQLAIGAVSAAVTYAVGTLIGASIS